LPSTNTSSPLASTATTYKWKVPSSLIAPYTRKPVAAYCIVFEMSERGIKKPLIRYLGSLVTEEMKVLQAAVSVAASCTGTGECSGD
jgi:hypothetical protein